MAVLQSTNVVGSLCVNGVAIGGGKDFNYRCFTSSISFTPTSDLVSGDGYVMAHVIGGGGGAGASYGVTRGGTSPTNVLCAGTVASSGQVGAGGEYYQSQSFITSTDAISVTVGAGGTSGSAEGTLGKSEAQGLSCCVCFYSESIAGSGSIFAAAGDGGTSIFNGITAYGGCGGLTCAKLQKACGKDAYCSCNIAREIPTTLTKAGLYGAFRYDPYNRTVQWGSTCCNNCPQHSDPRIRPSQSGSADYIPQQYDCSCCNFGYSGIGVEGVEKCRYCGTYPGCSISSNAQVSAPSNEATLGYTYSQVPLDSPRKTCGSGAAAGAFRLCSTIRGTTTNNFCATSSKGNEGNNGIVLIQWYE